HQKILLEEPKYLKGSIKFYKKNNNCLNKPIVDSGIDLILFSEEGYFQNIEDKIQPGLYWLLIDRKYVNNHENFKHMFDIREKKNFSQLGWMRKYNIFLIHINTDFDLYINNKDYSISISKSNYNLSELLYFTGKRLYCEVLHNRILSRIPVFSGETPPVLKVADNIKGEYIGVVKYLNNETWRDITSENADLEVNTENGYTYFDLQGKFIKNIKKMNSPLLLKYSLESYDLTGERIEKHVLWLPGLKIYQPCGILQKEVNPQSKLIFPNQVKVESQNGNLEEKPIIHLSLNPVDVATLGYINQTNKGETNFFIYNIFTVVTENIEPTKKRKILLYELSSKLKYKFDTYKSPCFSFNGWDYKFIFY
ncbi:MAG: hypothetical protein ACOC2W_04370, partial [bacterium]